MVMAVGRRPGRPTLAMVAELAGVSEGTASKVVNGRVGVGASTRARVEKIMAEIGYVPNGIRADPDGNTTRGALIEVVVDSLRNPYTSSLIGGVLDGAEPAGLGVVTRRLSAIQPKDPVRWAQSLAATGRIGVIEVTSAFSPQRHAALEQAGLPMVLIDPIDVPRADVLSVGATNWAGGMAATEHLLALGHRTIAYVGGPRGAICDQARAHGYLAAMRTAGLNVNLDDVPHGAFTFEQGLVAGTAVLSRADRPTAIFAGSDVTATGVLEAARLKGLRVPEQLSVVGFDNTFLAGTSTPRLTTVHQPLSEMGRTAVRVITRVLAGDPPESRRLELATHLVIRDSTAPPAVGHERGTSAARRLTPVSASAPSGD